MVNIHLYYAKLILDVMKNKNFELVSFLDFENLNGLENKVIFIVTAMMVNLLNSGIKILKVWPELNWSWKEKKDVYQYDIISLDEDGMNSKKLATSFFETDNGLAIDINISKWDEKRGEWIVSTLFMLMLIGEIENDFQKIIAKMW